MMVKELTSPQQQSMSQIIKGVQSGLEPDGVEIVVMSIKGEEETMVMNVANKIKISRPLGIVGHQSRCGGKEVA